MNLTRRAFAGWLASIAIGGKAAAKALAKPEPVKSIRDDIYFDYGDWERGSSYEFHGVPVDYSTLLDREAEYRRQLKLYKGNRYSS